MITYKDAGVDIEKGDALVEKIKRRVAKTYGKRVVAGVGGFACLYEITPEKLISAGTDGVGTKILMAQELGIHDTIGIDLVAMCVNDILCTGSTPLFFMDYLATGALDVEIGDAILSGIVDGCEQGEMALIGGETAEMPGLYKAGEYDLAGFAVGEVLKTDLIDGKTINAGDSLVAIPSSGPHSNGYSLIRKIFNKDDGDIYRELLTPTKIYVKTLKKILNEKKELIKGISHITGGGLLNVPRMNEGFSYVFQKDVARDFAPLIFENIRERSKLSNKELYTTFNMGMGLIIATSSPDELISLIEASGEKAYIVGKIEKGRGEVYLGGEVL